MTFLSLLEIPASRPTVLRVLFTPSTRAHSTGPCICNVARFLTQTLLYRVDRNDGRMQNIFPLTEGGFANKTAQETFCGAGDCVIAKVYDQSPEGNHLSQRISCVPGQGCVYHQMVRIPAPHDHMTERGQAAPHSIPRSQVNASKHKIAVQGGVEVYGMWFDPGYGYNVDITTGVAKGNEPESIYAVMSGTHYNNRCCFGETGSMCILLTFSLRPFCTSQTTEIRRTTSLCPGQAGLGPWKPSTLEMQGGIKIGASATALGSEQTWRRACTMGAASRRL